MSLLIPLERIADSPYQTRSSYEEEHVRALADSIAEEGLIQVPPARLVDGLGAPYDADELTLTTQSEIIRLLGEKRGLRVETAAGHTRRRAFQLLADQDRLPEEYILDLSRGNSGSFISCMPLNLRSLDDRRMAKLAWIENADRKDVAPIDEAWAIQKRMDDFDLTQQEVAGELGMARSTVANKLRLLGLPLEVQEHIQEGEINERQARALLPLFSLEPWEQVLADEFEISDEEGRGGEHHHPRGIFRHVLENRFNSRRIQESVESMKRSLKSIWEARQEGLPEGWRVRVTDHGLVAEYGEEGDEDYHISSVHQSWKEAADAAEHECLRRLDEHQKETAEKISELSATEMAERLSELGAPALAQNGKDRLQPALEEAEAIVAKEQPDSADTIRKSVSACRNTNDMGQAEYAGHTVDFIQHRLGWIKQDLRKMDRRETWLREEREDAGHPLVVSMLSNEISQLTQLRVRAKKFQEKLREEWLPKAQAAGEEGGSEEPTDKTAGADGQIPEAPEQIPEAESPSGDGMPRAEAAPDVEPGGTVGTTWPVPQLPAVWDRLGTYTKAELEEVHRRFKQEQWHKYGPHFRTSDLKAEQLEHVQAQLRFHANLEAVHRLDDNQAEDLLMWMDENAAEWGNGDALRRAKHILRSIDQVSELGEMDDEPFYRFQLREARRAGAFCYHLFYEERFGEEPEVGTVDEEADQDLFAEAA